ncbi:MAG: D-tyrosyl-tRNA(Tyr) deacylase [Dehalococcoidia bacterium]|nr:MAG: D-tyrosyl-tRNA(Tyr) deacylase [Dehalococcoidia bacterium]
MKALLQRVNSARVIIAGKRVSSIDLGLVVFVGVANDDTRKDVDYLVQKIVNQRIFSDDTGKFNLSAYDIGGELLLVSQFTLLADTRKGRRPNFTDAAPPDKAKELFEDFVEKASSTGLRVACGRFQQYMQVEINNDGPVTIMLDSRDRT